MIDLREIIANKDASDEERETYAAWQEALGPDLEALARNGRVMIPDDAFEDYARELAEDIGAISRDLPWPASCIDWDRAVCELQMDYQQVEVEGTTYWYQTY